MYLFDTDVPSNLMKRSPSHDLLKRVGSVPVGSRFTSSITLGELVYGAERCTAPEVPEYESQVLAGKERTIPRLLNDRTSFPLIRSAPMKSSSRDC